MHGNGEAIVLRSDRHGAGSCCQFEGSVVDEHTNGGSRVRGLWGVSKGDGSLVQSNNPFALHLERRFCRCGHVKGELCSQDDGRRSKGVRLDHGGGYEGRLRRQRTTGSASSFAKQWRLAVGADWHLGRQCPGLGFGDGFDLVLTANERGEEADGAKKNQMWPAEVSSRFADW